MKKSAVLFSRVDVVSRALARASGRASRASSFIYTLTLHPKAPECPGCPPRFSSTMRVTRSHQNAYPASAAAPTPDAAKSARLDARADSLSMPEVVLSQTMCLNPPRV